MREQYDDEDEFIDGDFDDFDQDGGLSELGSTDDYVAGVEDGMDDDYDNDYRYD